jgi:hypothetical protein
LKNYHFSAETVNYFSKCQAHFELISNCLQLRQSMFETIAILFREQEFKPTKEKKS